MESTKGRLLAKNTVYLYLRMIIVLFVTFYLSRTLLHTLGVEDYGTYNVVGSIVIFFSFLKQALTNATYRYIAYGIGAKDNYELTTTYSMAINCHILLSVIFFIVLEIAGVWFVNSHLNIRPERLFAANWVLQFSILTTCISIIQNPYNSNIVAHEHMDFYAVVSVVEVVLKLISALMLVYIDIDNLILYSFFLCLVSVITMIMNMSYANRNFKDTVYIRKWDGIKMKQFAKYSGWSIIVNGSEITAQQSISILFNLFIGVVGNAALAIANQVNSGLNQFVNNLCQAFNPQIIKSYASGDKKYFMSLIFIASKLSYSLLLLVSIPIIFNLAFILDLWLGNDYPQMTPAFISIILISYAFDSFQAPLWHAVHATGNLKTHQILIGITRLLSIPAMYVTIRLTHNANYMLLIWAFDTGICAIVRTIYMHYLIDLDLSKYFRDVVLRILILTILAIPAPLFIVSNVQSPLLAFLLSSFVSVFCTIFLIYLIILNSDEKVRAKKMLLNKIKK